VFEGTGTTFGQELLRPHRAYSPVLGLIDRGLLLGCAHITGGGFPDNVDRILPGGCDARVDTTTWTPDPIFRFLQETGNVEDREMYRTFNMGIGMVLVVRRADVGAVLWAGEMSVFEPRVIGEIVSGDGKVHLGF
jgi:phosphoribosylformylglycinamidine cyclo-ligase